jgi:hypothetical protein
VIDEVVDMSSAVSGPAGRDELSRRDALRRGLLVAGAVWTVPVVQMLSVDTAHADVASPPPPPTPRPTDDESVRPTRIPGPPDESPAPQPRPAPDQLPDTGGAPVGVVVAGASLIAGGVAVRAAARRPGGKHSQGSTPSE